MIQLNFIMEFEQSVKQSQNMKKIFNLFFKRIKINDFNKI